MKKVSISTNTLNRMVFGQHIFHTTEEAKEIINECDTFGEGAQVVEAYEMGDVNKRIEYKVFRGYVVNW